MSMAAENESAGEAEQGAEALARLRQEIDAIDAELHALLIRRAETANDIAAHKAKEAESSPHGPVHTLRPAREAQVLRALIERHAGAMPVETIIRLWREMMATQLALQGPFHVSVWAPANLLRTWDVARAYYGSLTPMDVASSAADVMRRTVREPGAVGVVPMPGYDEGSDAWWPELGPAAAEGLRIIAKLPFTRRREGRKHEPEALALAKIPLQASGSAREDDRTVLLIRLDPSNPVEDVPALLSESDMTAKPAAVFGRSVGGGPHSLLMEITGFVPEDDPRLETLRADERLRRVVYLGAYAAPVEL